MNAMALKEIILHPDPRLKKVAEPVSDVTTEMRKLADDMLQTMYEAPGIGLAAPQVGVLKRLGRHLNDNGVIFVEVPMEVWGLNFLQRDPVTHVNFFTPGSLAHALGKAGLLPSSSRLTGYLHPNGQTYLACVALASKAAQVPERDWGGVREAEAFLNPGLVEKLIRFKAAPTLLKDAVLYKLRRWRAA